MDTSAIAACRCLLTLCLLGGLFAMPLGAQNAPAKDKESPKTSAIKLPSGAIIVVTNNPDLVEKPEIYLSPEKYRELNDQIEQLKKQIAAEKAISPSSCKLDGRVEQHGAQSIVRLKATFEFRTLLPRSAVFLGCKKAQPIEARLESDNLPLLIASDKGLSVQVESAGVHTLTLSLELPLLPRGPKGNEVGFDLGLPGAPITILTFDAPAKVQRLAIGRRKVGAATTPPTSPAASLPSPLFESLEFERFDAERLKPGRGEALGPVTHLAVSWEEFGRPGVVDNARSAEADIQVTISDADIQAEARLRLSGPAKQWRFLAPFNAEVAVGRAPIAGSTEGQTTRFSPRPDAGSSSTRAGKIGMANQLPGKPIRSTSW